MRIDPIDPPPARVARRPWRALLDAIRTLSEDQAALLSHGERPWASVTFAGSRHDMKLRFSGIDAVAAGERFIAALPEHEFAIPGRLVADATVVATQHELLPEPELTVQVELLVLDEV